MERAVYGYPNAYTAVHRTPYYRNDLTREPSMTVENTPKTIMYFITVEPKFFEHLNMHKGQKVSITTKVGKLVGTLQDVFIDHVTLVSNGNIQHI
ncbi:MAG: hypothetical protein K0R55_2998, partial [Sporomusa sp.]|nr:hypothetical protein [Sporomusa sp.]